MKPKTKTELAEMMEGGKKLGIILSNILHEAKPGVSLLSLEEHAQDLIKNTGGTPSFQTVKGYRWATCLCVNEVVVHGVPSPYGIVLMESTFFVFKKLTFKKQKLPPTDL